jgi:hypothetical protein
VEALKRRIDARTDELAAPAFGALPPEDAARLEGVAGDLASRVAAAGAVPFPNPIGLPPPDGRTAQPTRQEPRK